MNYYNGGRYAVFFFFFGGGVRVGGAGGGVPRVWPCRGGEAERVCDTFSIMVRIEQGVQVSLCDLFIIILVMRKKIVCCDFFLSIFASVRKASHIISRTVSSLY